MGKNTSIQNIALNLIENKNSENFTILVNRMRPGLLLYAYNFLKDKDLAKDVVTQTFMAIWEKIEQYNPQYKFSTWVYAIARNEALGIKRIQDKVLSYDTFTSNHSKLLQIYNPVFNMNTECMSPTGEELTQTLFDASISAINELDEPYKTVMIERELNQKQLHIIAEELSMNLSTVKTRLRKGRKDVANIIYKKYPDLVDSYFGNEE